MPVEAIVASQILSGTILPIRLGSGGAGLGAKYLADDSTFKSIDLSGYIPYTGATTNVDLGAYKLTANGLGIGGSDSYGFKRDVNDVVGCIAGTEIWRFSNSGTWIRMATAGHYGIGDDVKIYRYATGPALNVQAAGGLRVLNLAGSADAALTCGAITASGTVSVTATGTTFPNSYGDSLLVKAADYPAVYLKATTPDNGWLLGVSGGVLYFTSVSAGGGTQRGNFTGNNFTVNGVVGAGDYMKTPNGYYGEVSGANQLGYNFNTVGATKIHLLTALAGAGSPFLAWGGITSAFPAIKRSSAAIALRLADDSADAALTCGAITASGTATFNGTTTSPDHVDGQRFGPGSRANQYSTSFGVNAGDSNNAVSTSFGYYADANYQGVGVGYSASGGWRGVAIGANSSTGVLFDNGSIAIGYTATSSFSHGIAIGSNSATTAANQFAIGAASAPITAVRVHTNGGSLGFANETGTWLTVSNAGAITASGTVATGNVLKVGGVARFSNIIGTDGCLVFSAESSGSATLKFGFRDATSTGSLMKFTNGSSTFAFRNGDDSADAALTCGAITASGTATFSGSAVITALRTNIWNSNDNNYSIMLWDNATQNATFSVGTTAPLFRLAGTTSSFPAIKRSSAAIALRLADDSADAALTCGAITASGTLACTTINSTGNVNLSGTYPYYSIIPSGWAGGSFYFQSGVNVSGTGTGDYTAFVNPLSKGFAFLKGNPNTTGRYDLVLDTSGNVGIGTGSPAASVDVYKASTAANQVFLRASLGANPLVTIQEGIATNYGGTVACWDGAGGSSYIRMRYNSGYPQVDTSSTVLTLAGSGFQQRFSNAYTDITIGGVAGFYLDPSTMGVFTGAPAARFHVTVASASMIGSIFQGAASQTANLTEWRNSAGTVSARVNAAGGFSNTGGQTQSEIFGAGATVTGIEALAVGYNAASIGNYSIALGASSSSTSGIAIGRGATVTSGVAIGFGSVGGSNGVSIGGSASGSSSDTVIGGSASGILGNNVVVGQGAYARRSSVVIGLGATTTASYTDGIVALGRDATAISANMFVAGSDGYPCSDVYFGKGGLSATPTAYTINGTGGSGTDIAGGALKIAGGKGTGNAVGGAIEFQTSDVGASGTTLQSLTTKLTIAASGAVTCGNITSSITGSMSNNLTIGTSGGTGYEAGIILKNVTNKWQLYDSSGLLRIYNYGTSTEVMSISAATTAVTFAGAITTNGSLTLSDTNLIVGTTTGTKIGTATGQKLGFWNATPVVQQILATGVGATVDQVIALLQTLGLCKQS